MSWEVLRPARASRRLEPPTTMTNLSTARLKWEIFQESAYQQDGATYHIVVDANPSDYDMSQLDETLEKITHAAVDWMQDRPYEEYTFPLSLSAWPWRRRMEHAYGTAIEVSAERLRASLDAAGRVSARTSSFTCGT